MLLTLMYAIFGLVLAGVVLFFFAAAPLVDAHLNRTTAAPPYPASDAARALHDRLLVADLHNDVLLWNRDLLRRHGRGHSDLPRLVDGGVGLQIFSVVTKVPFGSDYEGTAADSDQITYLAAAQRWPVRTWTSLFERACYQAEKLHYAAARSDGRLTVLRTRTDLNRFLARRPEGFDGVAGLLALEGLHALEGDPARIDTLARAGFRMMGLTHLHDNAIGGSSTGLEKRGLTDFGRQVVQRLDERHFIIDLAHASEALIDDVLATTRRPVLVSHTGVRATCDTPRNLSDRHVRAIAARDGLVGVGIWPTVVGDTEPAAIARAMVHVAGLVGVEHLALGTDFDGTVKPPFDATGFPQLTEALLNAGFYASEVRQIMGANAVDFLRRTLPGEG